MGRRRYLSTEISVDSRVNRLAEQYGDFSALLYTWMIPHAGDDACLTGDIDQLMFTVIPGRRGKTPEEVAAALTGMHDLGLIEWDQDNERIAFPPSAFYKHQSYIKDDRRGTAQISAPSFNKTDPAANQRKSAQISAEPCTSAQISASSPVSSPVPVSPGGAKAPPGAPAYAHEAEPIAAKNPEPTKAPPEPIPKAKGQSLAPLVDAFRALGLPDPVFIGGESKAANELLRHFSAADLAQCWQDHATGVCGDDFSRRDLSFTYFAARNRVGNWQRERQNGAAHRGQPAAVRGGVHRQNGTGTNGADRFAALRGLGKAPPAAQRSPNDSGEIPRGAQSG